MRLAFFAGGSVSDRRAWSGTTYYAHRALAKRFDVVPLEMPSLHKAMRGARKLFLPRGFDPLREPLSTAMFGRMAAAMARRAGAEAAFVLGASHIAADLAERLPVFHCSDATFASMVDYHAEFKGLSKRTLWAGNELERRVLTNSRAAILASERAADSVRSDYQRTCDVHVVPFGANLDQLPSEDLWQPHDECNLVFIGVQWYSKGADVAVEATRLLNERGVRAVLHIVGCEAPPEVPTLPFVRHHGFLRKAVPEEYARLTQLVASSDFLIVPTRFEAYGIVFCEAAAYGTPAVARRTGGVPTIIHDGITGILEPAESGASSYAARIQEVWSAPDRYREMRRQAFARSRSTLNWDAWGNRVETIIRESLAKAGSVDARL